MKFDNSKQIWKMIEKWVRIITTALLIPALGVFVFLTILENNSSYSYERPKDSDKRIIQQIICPSPIVRDKPKYIIMFVKDSNLEIKSGVNISITANNFVVQDKATVYKNFSDIPSVWWITPKETGKQSITISAVVDNELSDSAICEITVVYLLGLEVQTVYEISGAIIGLGIGFGILSLLERKRQSQFPSPKAG